jgi:plasmid stability protein
MIQVRHVPDDVHRRLKARAAASGQTLTDYLRIEIERLLERPSPEEIRERLRSRTPVKTRVSPTRAVRLERERA